MFLLCEIRVFGKPWQVSCFCRLMVEFVDLGDTKPILLKKVKRHTCRTCRKKFDTYPLLRQHRYYVHLPKAKTHLCAVCGKLFARKNQLQVHLELHDEKMKHYCEVCDKHLQSTHLVRSHRVFHSVAGQKCPDCGITYNFTSAQSFYAHRRLHRTTKEFVCDECGKYFKNKETLRQHSKTHEETTFSCEHCDKVFKCKSGLAKHVAIVHNGKRHICEMCGKGLTSLQNLRDHMMVHTGDKPYSCSKCDKFFITKQQLKIHDRNHTNEKPYPCTYWSKANKN